jgi:hypothetical protein
MLIDWLMVSLRMNDRLGRRRASFYLSRERRYGANEIKLPGQS